MANHLIETEHQGEFGQEIKKRMIMIDHILQTSLLLWS